MGLGAEAFINQFKAQNNSNFTTLFAELNNLITTDGDLTVVDGGGTYGNGPNDVIAETSGQLIAAFGGCRTESYTGGNGCLMLQSTAQGVFAASHWDATSGNFPMLQIYFGLPGYTKTDWKIVYEATGAAASTGVWVASMVFA